MKYHVGIGAPVLVIFFELPSDIDVKAAQASKKVSFGQMMQSAGDGINKSIQLTNYCYFK